MKHIKKFEEIENNIELDLFVSKYGYTLDDIIRQVSDEYGDDETGEDHTDWYLNELKDLYDNGGKVLNNFIKNNNK